MSKWCHGCGEPLDGKRRHAETCSTRCRVRVHRWRKEGKWALEQAHRWGLSPRDFWRTPPALFAELDQEFSFGLDAATAGVADALCKWFLTPEMDALIACWATASQGRPVFCNPPYSRLGGRGGGLLAWVQAAVRARDAGVVVVLVVPTTRSTAWAKLLRAECPEIRHPKARVAFIDPDSGLVVKGARHETMIPVLRPGHRGPPDEPDWP